MTEKYFKTIRFKESFGQHGLFVANDAAEAHKNNICRGCTLVCNGPVAGGIYDYHVEATVVNTDTQVINDTAECIKAELAPPLKVG